MNLLFDAWADEVARNFGKVVASLEAVLRHGGTVRFVCVERLRVIAQTFTKGTSGLAIVQGGAFATGEFVDSGFSCWWYPVFEDGELIHTDG